MYLFLKKYLFQIIFTVMGALGGFLYWKFVGCLSGTCPIRSVWYLSMFWGAAAGYLLGDITEGLVKWIKKKK